MNALGAIGAAVAPTLIRAAGNAVSGAASGAAGNVGARTALAGGIQGLDQDVLKFQRDYGLTPEQATAVASHIQDKERTAQSRMAQGSIYENAALQNQMSNQDVQRGAVLNAQQQQGLLANQLVNSVQSARDAATNAVMQGAQVAAGMSRGAIR